MKATLSNYRQSPRKVRLVANLIRGKKVSDARTALSFLPKKSAPQIEKLLNSAVSNAKNFGIAEEHLVVKTITVNKGMVLKRFKPMARGRGVGFRRTTSHVSLELAAAAPKVKKPRQKKAVK